VQDASWRGFKQDVID